MPFRQERWAGFKKKKMKLVKRLISKTDLAMNITRALLESIHAILSTLWRFGEQKKPHQQESSLESGLESGNRLPKLTDSGNLEPRPHKTRLLQEMKKPLQEVARAINRGDWNWTSGLLTPSQTRYPGCATPRLKKTDILIPEFSYFNIIIFSFLARGELKKNPRYAADIL